MSSSSQESDQPLVHLSRTLAHHQTHLLRLYTSLGHSDPAKCAANKIAELHLGILDTIETQAREAENEVNILTQQVNDIIDQIKNLRIRLGELDLDSDLHVDQEALVPKLDRINSVLADLNSAKFEREIQVENLLKKLESFGDVLDDSASRNIGPLFGANLSSEYINKLKKQIESSELEVKRREERLVEHINEIFNLWGHLGISPSKPSSKPDEDHSDIDPIVLQHLGFTDVAVTVNGDIKPIGNCLSIKMVPTSSNLIRVHNRQIWLDNERVKREGLIQDWYDELCILWTRLGIPESEQEEFVESWRGLSEECLDGYRSELDRMIAAKKAHMVVFIQTERDLIVQLWDQLFTPELERNQTSIFSSDNYDEDLLAAHEVLKNSLIQDLNDKKIILNLLNKYFNLLQEAHELEMAEKDPNRFTKVKGQRGDPGKLLREEKIRKRVSKEKPKLENELKKVIPEWENERGRPFMINGSRFLEDLVIRLDQEAASKSQATGRSKSSIPPAQSIKRQQTGNTSRPGSPVKRTKTGETTRSKPSVNVIRGSSNPFGTATPKPSSAINTTRQISSRLTNQMTGSTSTSVYKLRSQNNLNRPIQYQPTGSSSISSVYHNNPVTPTPITRPPSLTSTIEPHHQPLASSSRPSSRSVSSSNLNCPGIPPGWPSNNNVPQNTLVVHPSSHPPIPSSTSDVHQINGKPAGTGLGIPTTDKRIMPAPPIKKGIFRPRPSSILPSTNHTLLVNNNNNGNDHKLRVVSQSSASASEASASLTSPITSFIDLNLDHHLRAPNLVPLSTAQNDDLVHT
ncbi:hypothetical protein MJO29_012995 [Puccinia striiformis f. sp. tritici]|uniref:hypothetical protein n=1 Tax=Puccinia striiformis f. sp. tritici TaxID=168172 RepID=UPI002007FA47|nr:hypothetical protein Pst134EA_024442 [Puccinia striiformis f. sp. tritici]KAH9453574.1 hypothetical protein Pst134EA_024442 [Puccinia striiformis f. sp. tritici]KAI7943151.1 hypothetical protein MJO29_012995 [Puccinia striiformis f. sp. tritici]